MSYLRFIILSLVSTFYLAEQVEAQETKMNAQFLFPYFIRINNSNVEISGVSRRNNRLIKFTTNSELLEGYFSQVDSNSTIYKFNFLYEICYIEREQCKWQKVELSTVDSNQPHSPHNGKVFSATYATNFDHVNFLSTSTVYYNDYSKVYTIKTRFNTGYCNTPAKSAINWQHCDKTGADLSGADLSGAILYGADLREANLSGANLSGADLQKTHLEKTNLSNANLTGALIDPSVLASQHLAGSILSETTVWIDGKPCCSSELNLGVCRSQQSGSEYHCAQ